MRFNPHTSVCCAFRSIQKTLQINKGFFLIFLLLGIVITLCSFVSAEISVKNYSIEENYFGGQNIRGWINLSLTNEPYDTLVSGFNKNILLLNFLNNNNLRDGAGILCSVINCSQNYEPTIELSGILNLAEGTSTLIGFKVVDSGEIQEILTLLLNISTNAGTNCSENMQIPLKIDILDDGSFELIAKGSSCDAPNNPVACGEKNYGCYGSSNAEIRYNSITTTETYCEKIVVGPGGGIRAGADVSCSGNANFTIKLLNSAGVLQKQWLNVPSNETNIIPVYSNSSLESSREIIVCIQASNTLSAGKCSIGVQENGNNSCGYSGSYPHDFSIYARSIAYSIPANFTLSSSNSPFLNQNILNYLDSRYDKNCSAGCIIPIKIISNQNQKLIINNGQIIHKSMGFQQPSSQLYEIIKTSPLISMNYTLLDISKSGLTAPPINGNYTLDFKIGNKSIVQKIFVSNIPGVGFVFPYDVIVSEDTKFSAYSNFSDNITSYKWNFGDGSPEQTTSTNSVTHKYTSIKQYDLKVTATSFQGQADSVFQINVLALSKDDAIKRLNKNNENLANIETEVNKLPTWLKDYFNTQMKINDTKAELNRFIFSLNSTDNLTEVSSYLGSLNTASSFGISEISSGTFIVDQNKINPTFLKNAGAGNMNSNINESFYKNSVYGWLINNINIDVEEKVYSLFYNDKTEPAGSYLKITINPKTEYSGKLFLAINKNSGDIIFKDKQNTKNESQTTIVILNSSSSNREIELLVKGRVDPTDTPIYLSPEFSKLDLFSNPECFIDGKCDSSIGEDAETCPADCNSSIWQITISIIILLILAFIAYIILQEWYKRGYEDYLFKSKDDLYNIINFINNAEKQSMSKGNIFKNLLDMKWSNEQITFAYNRFHGRRTGMYEIPVLKIFEKRKIQLEVEKRQAVGNMGNIVPRPIIMPPGAKFMGGQKTNFQQNFNKNFNKKV